MTILPSISGGAKARPTRPPQVRLPIVNLPAPARRKYQGMASPPEPANSLISIIFGPENGALRFHFVIAIPRSHARHQLAGEEPR